MPPDDSIPRVGKLVEQLRFQVRQRVSTKQAGISTYFDKWLFDEFAVSNSNEVGWLEGFAHRVERGRFERFASRRANGTEIPDAVMRMSQGTQGPIRWKGLSLFKSAFDLALYTNLLGELRPGTIFEIGSGSGASAVWFADMCKALQIPCHVVSLDRRPPSVVSAGVTFVRGDCSAISDCIPAAMLIEAARPVLLIEDAHEHVGEVLRHFAPYMRVGDRIVVEDSDSKQNLLADFAHESSDAFLVDTLYTDFFGLNATSAMNSFLVRC